MQITRLSVVKRCVSPWHYLNTKHTAASKRLRHALGLSPKLSCCAAGKPLQICDLSLYQGLPDLFNIFFLWFFEENLQECRDFYILVVISNWVPPYPCKILLIGTSCHLLRIIIHSKYFFHHPQHERFLKANKEKRLWPTRKSHTSTPNIPYSAR